MKKRSDRISRINELLKREIAEFLEKNPFESGECLISITEVDTSSDLRHAKIYVSVLGGNDQTRPAVIKHLGKKRPDLQHLISIDLKFKYTPVLEFFIDKKYEEADRVLSLINEMEEDEQQPG